MNRPLLTALCCFLLSWALLAHIGCSEESNVLGSSINRPKTWYVDLDATGTGSGKRWEDAFTHPAEAMEAASSRDQIWVAEGTYYGPGTKTDPVIAFKAGVKVYGGFNGDETSISEIDWKENLTVLSGGDSLYHVVTGADDAMLYGFYVRDGFASGSAIDENIRGAGIYCWNAKMRISNCNIRDNTAEFGGGIYAQYDTVLIDSCHIVNNNAVNNGFDHSGGGGASLINTHAVIYDCTFYENSATARGGAIIMFNTDLHASDCSFSMNTAGSDGGAVYITYQIDQSIEPLFDDCEFEDNQADNGGAIYNAWANPHLVDCVFEGNTANELGGAMHSENSSFVMEHCVVRDNRGPALYNRLPLSPDQPRIFCCLFYGNATISSVDGGAIFNRGVDPDIECCTIADNSANNGGGIYNEANASPNIINCIIWGNTSVTGDAQIFDDTGSTSVVTYCDIDQDGYDGANGNIRLDPLFTSFFSDDYYLSSVSGGQAADSPCIDAGSDSAVFWGLDQSVTSTLNIRDSGVVDMGYHYPYILLLR